MMDSAAAYRRVYSDESKGVSFLATDDFTTTGANFIAVKSANHQIFLQSVWVNVTTAAAQSITAQDDAATPVVFGKLAVSAALGSHQIVDGGDEGIPLTLGKNLDLTATAAGVAGSVMVQAYQRLVGPVSIAASQTGG